MTLATPPLGRTHHFWGQFADAASLPNVAASPTQSPPIGGVNVLQAGDVGWAIAELALYACEVPTTGAAIWVPLGAGSIPLTSSAGDGLQPQSNRSAVVAPLVTDDSASGYLVGSYWIDTATDTAYRCVDDSVGAAIWQVVPVVTSAAPVNVDKSAAAVGTSEAAARADHKHDTNTAAAVEITDSTNSEGSASTLSRSDHGHSHGTRGGGALHSATSAAGAGFQPQSNRSAAVAPLVTDDSAAGYAVGSYWVNTTLDSVFVCVDASVGAAVWLALSSAAEVGGQLSWGNETLASSTTTRYLEPWFNSGLAPTTPVQFEVTRAGTLRNMYVRHNSPGGSGTTITYTLRVNSVATALLVALASTSATGSDLANSVVVAAGDTVDIEVTKAGTAGGGSRIVMCEVEFA